MAQKIDAVTRQGSTAPLPDWQLVDCSYAIHKTFKLQSLQRSVRVYGQGQRWVAEKLGTTTQNGTNVWNRVEAVALYAWRGVGSNPHNIKLAEATHKLPDEDMMVLHGPGEVPTRRLLSLSTGIIF